MGKRKIVIVVVVIVWYNFVRKLLPFHLNPSEEVFTEVRSCPACYGQNLCPHFFHGDLKLIGGSKIRALHLVNRKNVYYGRMDEQVVLKKLGHDWELKEGDHILCSCTSHKSGCDVRSAIKSLAALVGHSLSPCCFMHILKKLNSSTDVAKCPSERLFRYMYDKIISDVSNQQHPESTIDSIAEMIYSIVINPEPLFLRTFPQSEGWPFPQYKGACGRVIVEEYVGLTLAEYEDSSWKERLSLSYQLLQIAQILTLNSLDFALYMTDVNMYNFAVKLDGTVLLVDVENIIIVDRQKVRTEQLPGWNQMHVNRGEGCKDCLSFSVEDLCSHDISDHNYYAICKGILAPGSYYSQNGLLHDIPPDINNKTNLLNLLKECAEPVNRNRFKVVSKLLQAMKALL